MFSKTGGSANNLCSQKHLIAAWFCEWLQNNLNMCLQTFNQEKKLWVQLV
jgi:hypothetical protein